MNKFSYDAPQNEIAVIRTLNSAQVHSRRCFVTSKQNLPEDMLLADRSIVFDDTTEYQQAVEVYRGKVKQRLPKNEMAGLVNDLIKVWKSSMQDVQKRMINEQDIEL